MEDYPHTLAEFEDRFTTEDACRAYLVQMRWPTGFRCLRCTAIGGWATKRSFMMCSQCGPSVNRVGPRPPARWKGRRRTPGEPGPGGAADAWEIRLWW